MSLSNKWSKFDHNRKAKILDNGAIVVIAPFKMNTVPLFCSLCRFPMHTRDDGISYRQYGCCHHCDNHWRNYPDVDLNKKSSWPDKSSDEWKEYIEHRRLLSTPILNFE